MWVQSHLFSGHVPQKPPRTRAKSPFWNTYQAEGGQWFVVAMARSDEAWPGLCQALGQPQLENDPRFDTHAKRLENSQELIGLLDRVFATRPREEWLRRLREAGLIVAPVNTYAEVANDPQVRENDYIVPVEHPVLGPSLMVGFPIRFSATPVKMGPTAPQLGQHTEEVLLDICGYGWDEIAEMKTAGAII
jgi:crotonobetainyl-CoA:carnitine CoA-transferase CaiB-like acyl-CoA transferase